VKRVRLGRALAGLDGAGEEVQCEDLHFEGCVISVRLVKTGGRVVYVCLLRIREDEVLLMPCRCGPPLPTLDLQLFLQGEVVCRCPPRDKRRFSLLRSGLAAAALTTSW
jgi:hypothetical protein